MIRGNNIICFSNDWDQDPLSKHHIMSRLAKQNRILWVNSIGMRTPEMTGKDIAKVRAKLRSFFRSVHRVQENLYVMTPLVVPFHGVRAAVLVNRYLLLSQVRHCQRTLDLDSPIFWTFLPNVENIIGRFGEKLALYYVTDDFAEFEGHAAESIARMERSLLAKVDLAFCVSSRLFEKRRSLTKEIHLMRHGVDYEYFVRSWQQPQEEPPDLKSISHPVLGFWGELNESLDYELLRAVALAKPNWSIVLIGSPNAAGAERLTAITGLSNIHHVGHKPFSELARYASYFDVALLPKNSSELSLNMNPLKLREYLAAGVPVVSSPLPEVLPYGDVVKFAETPEELIAAVEDILKEDRNKLSPVLSKRVAGESWDAKVEEISEIIEKALARKLIGDAVS